MENKITKKKNKKQKDYVHLSHTEDIVAHVAANRPLSEIAQWAATGIKPNYIIERETNG